MLIRLPDQGLNTTGPASAQPPGTSADLLNWRPFQSSSGRRRFAQRPGVGPYARSRLADSKVGTLAQITFDSRKFTYSALTPAVSAGAALSRQAVRAVLDRQGNVFAIEGTSTVVKLNAELQVVWRLNLPISDRAHVVSAIFVDPQDFLYVGVTSGGAQSTAKFWRYRLRVGNDLPVVAWEIQPDAYVRKIRVKGDAVHVLLNKPDHAQAFHVVFRGGDTDQPVEAWRREVAYPANHFALKENGDVIGCSLANATRGIDPMFPLFTERTQDATLRDILGTDYDTLLWRDNNAASLVAKLNINGTQLVEGEPALRDRDPVLEWPDDGTGERDLFRSVFIASQTPPLYNARGIGGKPSVYFRGNRGIFAGSAAAIIADALQSDGSPSGSEAYADQHQGLIPGYFGAQWIMFIVMRPEEDRATAPARQAVWGQPASIGGIGNERQGLYVNRDDSGAATPGYGSFFDGTSSRGVGTGGAGAARPNQFQYGAGIGPDNQPITGNPTSTVVLTIGCDGGMTPILPDSAATMHSFLRVNGKPIDRWETAAGSFTIDPGILGHSHNASGGTVFHFRGDIARIIVVHKLGVAAAANAGPITHPKYPHNLHDAVTVPVGNIYNAVGPLNATQVEQIEGMLAHEYGISHLLPTGAATTPTYNGAAPFRTTNNHGNYPHPFYRTAGPPRAGGTSRSEPYQMHTKQPCVWKLDGSTGDVQWVLTGTSGEDGGGLGYSVAVKDDSVYSVGPNLAVGSALIDGSTSAAGTGDINIRKFTDLNVKGAAGFSTSVLLGQSNWQTTLGAGDWDTSDIEIALDDHENLCVPISYAALASPATLKVYASAPDGSGAFNVGNELVSYDASVAATSVAPAPTPDYRFGAAYDFDRNPTTDARTARTEFVFVSTATGLDKVRLVTATPISGTPRQTVLYQVNGGNLRRFDTALLYPLVGASTIADPQFSTTAQFISWAVLFGKIFWTDGASYFYTDPRDDAHRSWKPLDGGKMDPRNKLLVNWNGRAVIARGIDNPHQWHMSAMGDPFRWNQFAVPQTATRAISGTNASIGACPDIVNALYPFTDRILLFGCDKSIWAMVGDPADFGRQVGFHEVSKVTGASFGRSITTDPQGNVYVHGSQGGIWRGSAGGSLQSISDGSVYAQLRDIDLSQFRAELVWNAEDDGLHVFFIPYDTGTATHYFWDRATGGWFPDEYGYPPHSLLIADGDLPNDRKLLLGNLDGYVRSWDRTAKSDDGTAISLRCLIGPMTPEETPYEWRFRDFAAVLASDSDPVQVTLFGSDTPDEKGPVRKTFELSPGRNPVQPVSIAASYVWVLLEQFNANRTVAIESLAWNQIARGGRKSVTA